MESGRKKQMALGAIISYLAIGARLLSGLLYTPVILKSLGQSEYGVYSLCISFTGYLTIFNAGMNAAYVRYYIQAKETGEQRVEKLNGTFLKIFFALGIVGFAAGMLIGVNCTTLFGSRILPSEYTVLKKSFYILAVIVFLTSVNGVFNSAIIAHEKFVIGKLVDFLHTLLIPVITIPFLLLGHGSVTILAVQAVLTAGMLIFNSLYSIRKLNMKFMWKTTDTMLLRSIAIFSGLITIQAIMDQLNWQVDKLILARVRGADEVAVYSVGSQFNSIFMLVSAAITGVFITEINRLVAHREDLRVSDLFVRSSRILAYVSIFIMSAFIFFGKPFIALWAGPGYENAYTVAVLIMLPVTFSLSQGLGQDIARAKNLHKTQILSNICVCVLNFLVSIPLAIKFGAVGSAWGTFGCEVVICVIVQPIYYHKVVKLNIKEYYMEMLKLVPGWLIPFAAGAALMFFNLVRPTYSSIFAYAVLYTAIYAVSIWCISLSDKEKRDVKGVIAKFMRAMT